LSSSADTSLNSIGSASLAEYRSDTYVIINAEGKRKGSLETGSLLPPGIIHGYVSIGGTSCRAYGVLSCLY
jgi:hypothetical protein